MTKIWRTYSVCRSSSPILYLLYLLQHNRYTLFNLKNTYLEIIASKPFVSAIVGTVLCVIATIVVVFTEAADVVVPKKCTAIVKIVKHEHNDAVRVAQEYTNKYLWRYNYLHAIENHTLTVLIWMHVEHNSKRYL